MAESFPLKIIFDAVNRTGPAFQQVNKGLENLKKAAGVIRVTMAAAIAGIGVAALKNAADFEALEVKFKGMLGSAEKGKDLAKTLADFASKTPFQLKGLSENATQLLAFGSTTEQLIPQLTILGDIAAGVGKDISELITPFGRIQNADRATLIELDKFEDRGVPIIRRIGEMTGKSYAEVRKAVSDGAVDFKIFNAALLSIRTEKFNNAMAELSKTLGGKWSNIIDSTDLALAALGRVLIDVFDVKGLADGFIDMLLAIKNGLESLDPQTINTIKVAIQALVNTLSVVFKFIGYILAASIAAISIVSTLLSPITKLIWEILKAWLSVTSRMEVTDLASAFQAWSKILASINEYLDWMIGLMSKISGFFAKPIGIIFEPKFSWGGVDKQVGQAIRSIQANSIAIGVNAEKIKPPNFMTSSGFNFSSSPAPAQGSRQQEANLGITVDVKNGTANTKIKSASGFNIDKSKIKVGRIAEDNL